MKKSSNFFEKLLLILVIYFKIHISYMTEEKWKLYFTNLSNRRLVRGLYAPCSNTVVKNSVSMKTTI